MPRSRPSRTTPEALQALRERLQATQEAAQRLAEEAAEEARARAAGGPEGSAGPADPGDRREGRPPPAGWDVPRRAGDAHAEIDALLALLAQLRDLLPPELRAQLAELARQILVFVRAVLDWWIERMDGGVARGGGRDDVEDIPIA
jgi:hypothetical protein